MSFENLDGKGVALPYTQSLAGWQFISSATTKAFTVEMYDFTGAMVGEFTTASPTVAGFASTLSWTETTGGAAVAWNPLWAGFVVKTTVATSYAKDASGHVPVTAVNGTALAIGMPIGVVPQRLYDAYYGAGGTASGSATAANQLTGFSISPTTFTVGTAAYIAGDSIGGILTLPLANFSTGRPIAVDSLALIDKSNQAPAMTIMWFKATPSGGTYTDGAALVLAASDADLPNYVGTTRILTGDWIQVPSASTTGAILSINDLNMVLPLSGTSLFALIQADGAYSLTGGDLGLTVSGRRL